MIVLLVVSTCSTYLYCKELVTFLSNLNNTYKLLLLVGILASLVTSVSFCLYNVLPVIGKQRLQL